jgi:hypothetical protein
MHVQKTGGTGLAGNNPFGQRQQQQQQGGAGQGSDQPFFSI